MRCPALPVELKKNYWGKNKLEFVLPPGYAWVPSKNFSPFGPAVWPAIWNI